MKLKAFNTVQSCRTPTTEERQNKSTEVWQWENERKAGRWMLRKKTQNCQSTPKVRNEHNTYLILILCWKKWGIEVAKWLFKILFWISKSHTCIFSWQARALCGFTSLGSCDLRLFELIISLYYPAFSVLLREVQKLMFDVVRLRATIVFIYYYVCHNGTW